MVFKSETKQIYTVSQITEKISEAIESSFSFIWITGEISNFSSPSSGHFYFSLKDSKSIINAVIFKNQQINLKFIPENGLEIVGFGRISLYPPRGSYQIIFEYMEPKGIGSLQLQFEQTKEKFKKLGYFDDKNKKKIPFFPEQISIITSPTGAAIRDILKTLSKRFKISKIQIYPVSVQGENSPLEIIEALEYINKNSNSDIIILARGGGSFEDLSGFNDEALAIAVYNSEIPVITGIGHETDFTIADFVSDLRAPTPTAAAQYSVPDKAALLKELDFYEERLERTSLLLLNSMKEDVLSLKKRLRDPEKEILNSKIFLDELISKMERRMLRVLDSKLKNFDRISRNFKLKKLQSIKESCLKNLDSHEKNLFKNFENKLEKKFFEFENKFSALFELGPYNILGRGYSIVRKDDSKKILRSVKKDVKKDDKLEIILSDGKILCTVNKIY